ncbi:response regulator transcription factor [Dermacoccus barathri]|uniref:response regulator transcription factor n=1 Tax=Dermacoccus barathri TaxID=322601 RepID=UPI00187AD238|nr:helix-turn-helix transcriptional regulator [Dermacoccus barathri]
MTTGGPGAAEGLTEREAQAVTLICRGLPNGAIANELNVSLNTLKSYIRSAYRTMGVASRSEAVLWGVARGLHVDAHHFPAWRRAPAVHQAADASPPCGCGAKNGERQHFSSPPTPHDP